jgi:hypothetical protein
MSVETNWSDQEWAAYLRGSSDPDDQSLALRLALVERLKTRQRLNQREAKLFELLKGMNKAELDFLKAPTVYKLAHDRPAWPRWHWPPDLEELFLRTN